MARNGHRIAALDNARQMNPGKITSLPVDMATPTEPWIHDEHHLGRRLVNVSDLVATQERYDPSKVKAMKSRKTTMPKVVFTDEGALIHDGHHRALSAVAQGRKRIWVDGYNGRAT